jgi:hypothetical protein
MLRDRGNKQAAFGDADVWLDSWNRFDCPRG